MEAHHAADKGVGLGAFQYQRRNKFVVYKQVHRVADLGDTQFSRCGFDKDVGAAAGALLVPLPACVAGDVEIVCCRAAVNNLTESAVCRCNDVSHINVAKHLVSAVSRKHTYLRPYVGGKGLVGACYVCRQVEVCRGLHTLEPQYLCAFAVVGYGAVFVVLPCAVAYVRAVVVAYGVVTCALRVTDCFHDEFAPLRIAPFLVEMQSVVQHVGARRAVAVYAHRRYVNVDEPCKVFCVVLDKFVHLVILCALGCKHRVVNKAYPVDFRRREYFVVGGHHFLEAVECRFCSCAAVVNVVYTDVEHKLFRIVQFAEKRYAVRPIVDLRTADADVCFLFDCCCLQSPTHAVFAAEILPEVHVTVAKEQYVKVFTVDFLYVTLEFVTCHVVCYAVVGNFHCVAEALEAHYRVFRSVERSLTYKFVTQPHENHAVVSSQTESDCFCSKVKCFARSCKADPTCTPTAVSDVVTERTAADHADVLGRCVVADYGIYIEEYTILACAVKQHKTELTVVFRSVAHTGKFEGCLCIQAGALGAVHYYVVVGVVAVEYGFAVGVIDVRFGIVLGEVPAATRFDCGVTLAQHACAVQIVVVAEFAVLKQVIRVGIADFAVAVCSDVCHRAVIVGKYGKYRKVVFRRFLVGA